ncbi:urease accessory protein UreD, partial [Nostoc sp. NIES-2111]
AFMALIPEPVILFPGADCAFTCRAELGQDAVLILGEAFTWYDPFVAKDHWQVNRSCYRSDITLCDASGRLLLRDVSMASGLSADALASPVGAWSVVGTYLLAGPAARLPQRPSIESLAVRQGIIAGVTGLPNQAGFGVRCLAADAQAARSFADALFALGAEAALGARPAVRRK